MRCTKMTSDTSLINIISCQPRRTLKHTHTHTIIEKFVVFGANEMG